MSRHVVAILETMWDWRGATSGAGYREAPRYFRINRENFSGRRLYKLIGPDAKLLVTDACRELVRSAKEHGTPDPAWLEENLRILDIGGIDVLLVCGKVAQQTFAACGYKPRAATVLEIPHPAARRVWSREFIDNTTARITAALQGAAA